MKVKVGNKKVDLKDFIRAVVTNLDNKIIKFNIKDAEYDARVRFKVKQTL